MTRRRGTTRVGVRRVALTAAATAAALLSATAAAQADPLTSTSLSDAATMSWTGGAANDRLGIAAGAAGDVNRDGRPDVLARTAAGTAYVLFTPPSLRGTYSIGVNALAPTRGYKIQLDGGSVGAITNAGDQNGDGVPDQIVEDEINAVMWIVYGVKDPAPLPKCNPSGATRCLTVDGTTAPAGGYQITSPGDFSFGALPGTTGTADFNGDGVQDIVVGGTTDSVTVLYGGRTATSTPVDLTTLPASEALRIDSPEPALQFGSLTVGGVKDLNGDGRDEVAIGAFAGTTTPAAVYVVFGRSGAASPMATSSFGPADGLRVGTFALSNPALQNVGDVNGDGRPDMTLFGQSFVTPTGFGGGFVYTPQTLPADPIPMTALTASQGYLFKPVDAAPMLQGAPLGDLNGDGVPDVVGGNNAFALADGSTGFAQVVFGKRPTPASPFTLGPSLTPDKGVALFDPASKGAGSGFVPAGDLDGDGLPDFFVSASTAANGALANAGAISLIPGASLVPVADTAKAQRVTDAGATIGGSVTVQKQGRTKAHVEYGPTTAYGAATEDVPVYVADRLSEEVSGLAPSTTYHYRIVATNALGLTRYGQDRTFTTAATPVVPPPPDPCVVNPDAAGCKPVPPPVKKPAALSVSVSPSSKAAKVGKAATFSVKVGNAGEVAASGVKVCASVSSRVTIARKCVTVGALAGGASKKASFSAKGTKKAKGHTYKVTFKATATGLSSKSASAKVSVR